ncbi:molybdenum cofactor biosynthesis protein B [Oikeobacillus pervagus]|uniref:Molybdenum cofactor biosynthesis protein B n=1 Tax=Oikeobacillus pervagus TaxID=1325931 RepID=A0AAJ1T314_9BACI|nr:MogA/MoaB family molybdenum cofactor biosynthesis protein [Oikeobacillus pervagus]MDQ0215004.1 molybdenum cofactor biosynthesis protein B [Oikeobacillus pervagus]
MSVIEHKKNAAKRIVVGIITISDTRTKETDKSGLLIKDLLHQHQHEVVFHEIVKDEKTPIQSTIQSFINSGQIDVILLNGGTGLAPRDVTIETVQPMFEKEISGFGEIFRMLSYTEDIGSAAILSRAAAGVLKQVAIFAMPGSTGAVKLAMNKLILPEIGHIVSEIKKTK